jgi:hypothetical protein
MVAGFVQFARFLGAVLLLVACCSASAIQVVESGVEAARQSPVFWVSADEVLFSGPSGEYVTRSDGFRKPVTRLTTWNVRTKETKRYNELDAGLCYYEGNIAFWEIDNALLKQWTSIGRFPGEIKRFAGDIPFDPLTCAPVESRPPLPAWTKDRSIMRLRPGDGFLDFGSQQEPKNLPIRLVRNDGKQIELPIRSHEVSRAWVQYYVFKGAYFFPGDFFRQDSRHPHGGYNLSPWPEGKPRPVRWLYPNGSVEELLLPAAKWTGGILVPTKIGIVALDNTFFTVTGEAPSDGIYLLDRNGWSARFSRGLFYAQALSAEGCKLAAQRQPEPGKRRPEYSTVTIYDVCRGR